MYTDTNSFDVEKYHTDFNRCIYKHNRYECADINSSSSALRFRHTNQVLHIIPE